MTAVLRQGPQGHRGAHLFVVGSLVTWANPGRTMNDDHSLFEPALEAWTMSAHWSWPGGWTLRLAARREGQMWGEGYQARYDDLSTGECLDVAEAELEKLQRLI